MAFDELRKAVDREGTEIKTASLVIVILGILAIGVFLLNPLINHLLFPSFPVRYDSFSLLLVFIWIQWVYVGFRRLRLASKIGQSLKRGAVSGAMTLLDSYDIFYGLARYIILLDASVFSAFLLYWLTGTSLSWWAWNDVQFAAYILLLIMMFAVGITYIPFMQKWKARNKARGRIQKLMEEYLQQQSGS